MISEMVGKSRGLWLPNLALGEKEEVTLAPTHTGKATISQKKKMEIGFPGRESHMCNSVESWDIHCG